MGDRYYITGVQLGILIATVELDTLKSLLETIQEKQFIGSKEKFNKMFRNKDG